MATTNYDPEGIAIAPDNTLWIASEGNASDSRPNLVRVQAADNLFSSSEKSVYNMLPNLKATKGWITDKPEGVAITSNGRTYVVTDNDGVEDWSGETWFLDLGRFQPRMAVNFLQSCQDLRRNDGLPNAWKHHADSPV